VIDLRKLREDEGYRRGVVAKGVDPSTVDRLVSLADAHRAALAAAEELRARSNAASKEIGRAAPDERQAKIDAAGELKARLGEAETELSAASDELDQLALTIPNPAHPSVPVGDEDDYRVEVEVGRCAAEVAFDHGTIGERLGLVDTERAVRMSGSRFAYVMGDAVRLQFALIQYALDRVSAHGFTPVVTPVLVREEMMELAGFFPTDRNQVYALEADELYLIGTSEVALAGLHREERIDEDQLPVRYAGYSSCFRREAGTYGKDTSGLFRVHQFDKVEMFVYAHPDRSWDELELLRQIQEELIGGLDLPYRVITVASGDLGAPAAKKYDLEVWLPSEQRYREVTSCSNYTDYSARRMGTRVRTADGNVLAHTLNGTACAIGRTLLYIFENHQQPDGSIVVPDALRPLCGLEVIGPKAGS
jgi:seryl-tRNA synthetase